MENISQSCYQDIMDTNYSRYLFPAEMSFDYWWAFYWLVDNWRMSLYFISFYLVAIFFGHHYMKLRPAYKLRGPLFLWNASLAVFSIMASSRLIPEIYYMVQETGFHSTICSAGTVQHKQAISLWIWLIVHSKVVELGDTAFIILRKTPLIFLHWYHHVSVLIFTWSSAAYPSAIQLYFATVNAFVHSIMYSYYALKVLRVPIPRTVSMAITSVQLLQMIVGVYVTIYAHWAKSMDDTCCVFNKAITIATSVYVSYFVLFLNFFIKSYITEKPLFDGMGVMKKKVRFPVMDNISQSCFLDVHSANYSRSLLALETSFDYWWAYYWMVNNWKISLNIIAVYPVAIFGGQHLMRHRKPFKLRGPLFLWNLALALFSIVASTRLIPEMVYMARETGFHGTVCSAGSVQHKQAVAVWLWLFAHSKIVELGDTVFIVLRKTPLIFLHWYHHLSVLVFAWSSAAYPSAIQLHFAAVNVFVHSFMYSYYALKVLGVRVPKGVSMAITSLQLLQMVIGVGVTLYASWARPRDETCCVFYRAISIATSVYLSYLVLFVNFFVRSYVTKKPLSDVIGPLKKKLQ